VPVLRDPEIEVPEDESEEAELEEKFTKIQLDRMHDGSEDGECGEELEQQERLVTPVVENTRKRKFTPSEEGTREEPLAKRAASPRSVSSPLRHG
jgi:hypothetical protein